ncbi:DUF624 domain-containing protein [Anaeromassilibacillus sp. An200]|uniref:DUF624 domain-containing protein n=1 Tax=Anaeromassilibacillus sp. An200 TaxID=1965587 RepID=UPI0013A633B5|nr:DUF624 domain-containing protein [Anaeromassilibacillus sp. An200]
MGLFSINYNKPGPGVSKDAPVKKPFFRFWEVYFRKFFDLIKVNLLFAIPTAVIVVLSFMFGIFISSVNPNLSFLGWLPMIFLSPFVAGLTFVCRNYAREEHAFILSDFWDAVKNNWKQFLANGIICYIFYVLMSISIPFYSAQLSSNSLLYIPFVVCCIISFLFICAQFYIPVMIITFDLGLKQIYKNALIFAIVGLWRNLMLIAILAVFIVAAIIFFLMIPALAVLVLFALAVFWMFGFFGFLINFAVYPMIVKFIITPYEKAQQEKKKAEAGENTEEEEEDEPDFQDSLY